MAKRVTRAIAVGSRVNVAAWATESAAVAEIERIAGMASPFIASDKPNLIVLGELLGLPGALIGRTGALARRMNRSRAALIILTLANLPRVLAMRRRWPGISLVRALLLARTDSLVRPLLTTLPRLARLLDATIVAGTAAPSFSFDGQTVAPTGPEVFNIALVATPDGATPHVARKVFLTETERQMLDLVPGEMSAEQVVETPAGRLGIAVSQDAFTPALLHHLDDLGAEIVVQPDANQQLWTAPSATFPWQPQEWLNSVLGSVQKGYPHLQANVCAMLTGNFFDITFDGQSSITHASTDVPDPARNFVGNDGSIHTETGASLTGEILSLAPWVMDDPGIADPSLTLEKRRAWLHSVGELLLPGHPRAGQFREVAIWADIELA